MSDETNGLAAFSEFVKLLKIQTEIEELTALRRQAVNALAVAAKALESSLDAILNEFEMISHGQRFPRYLVVILHPFRTHRLIKRWESEIRRGRDMLRSAKLVLIDALRAAEMPYDALAHLFEPNRAGADELLNDLRILLQFYMPLGDTLRARLNEAGLLRKFYEKSPTSTPPSPEQVPALAKYERDAYLSFVEAIKQKPELASRPLREVYAWIKENGVEIDGAPYDLPSSFDTWQRYRSGGERKAKD